MIYEPFIKDTVPATPGGDQLQLNFLNMYRASLDPRVLAVMDMPNDGTTRVDAAIKLAATTGLLVDLNIVGEGWDPLFTMSFRIVTCGYQSGPNACDPPASIADMQGTGLPIKYSLTSDDYPAFVVPGLPSPPPGVRWVGPPMSTQGLYNSTSAAKAQQATNDPYPNGAIYTEMGEDGNLKRYMAIYPCPPSSPRALPTWLMWELQTP
jgi:hypothetical protein